MSRIESGGGWRGEQLAAPELVLRRLSFHYANCQANLRRRVLIFINKTQNHVNKTQ
jgi:hypothetical protein